MLKIFLSLVRWPNLVLIALIQVIVYIRLMDYSQSVLAYVDLAALVMITLLIGASGYIINDYYDVEIDKVNKPEKWIVGNRIRSDYALRWYKLFILCGALLSFLVGYRMHMLLYFPLYLLAVVGLQLYSSRLKCSPLLGNIWVSFFCGGVILIIALPDLIEHRDFVLLPGFWYFIFFAFLTTFYREVIKDLEDMHGDQKQGCQTFVVRYGLKKGKVVALLLASVLLGTLAMWENTMESWVFRTGLFALQGAVIGSSALLWWAKDNTYFHHASTLVKLIMAGGILLLLIPV